MKMDNKANGVLNGRFPLFIVQYHFFSELFCFLNREAKLGWKNRETQTDEVKKPEKRHKQFISLFVTSVTKA
jgi:hypothetical protein